MKCPYCLSLVEDEAVVCKVCTRDLYLFKPLSEKIRQLEEQLHAQQSLAHLQARIQELEALLQQAHESMQAQTQGLGNQLFNLAQFIFIPLVLLLMGHALVTVVYDINMLYLRIVSMVLPLPFGIYLFKTRQRSILAWFMGTAVLAVASVIGMSAITGWVDQTPVLPQSMVEWREFIEYAASITFSFLTGMLLGGMSYHRKHRVRTKKEPPFLMALVAGFTKGKSSPKDIQDTIKKLEEVGGSLVAAGTTAMSIYTGLKGFM